MKYSTIKNSGVKISKIGFGCSNFGGIGSAPKLVGKGDSEKDCHRMLNMAYEFGINYFDTASTYGAGNSERILGRWLKEFRIPRDKVVISSKIGGTVTRWWFLSSGGLSKQHIKREIDHSLKRLDLDHIDLLYIHMPDPNTPIEETLAALGAAVDQGKVRFLGASNIETDYLNKSIAFSRSNSLPEYKAVQNEYSLINRGDEKTLIPYCSDNNILYVGYAPLSGGLLSGKYKKDGTYPKNSRMYYRSKLYRSKLTEQTFSKIDAFFRYACEKGISLPVLSYAWIYEKDIVDSFLIGTRNQDQFKAVRDSINVQLSVQEWKELESIHERQ